MRNFSDDEFVKLFRRMVYWEWYTDINTKVLFIHCLIMANWRDGNWKGMPYKRGQFYTSIENLASETGLTIRQTRTALDHLQKTNEVTCKTTNKNTLITVVSFDKYQGERQTERQANRQTNDTQNDKQNDKEATSKRQQNKNNKNNKNISEEKNIKTASPDGGGSKKDDGGGEAPEGWTPECESGFQESRKITPDYQRKEWWDDWKEMILEGD